MKKTFNICEICKSNQWEIIYFGKIRDGKYGKQKNNATISQCSKCGIQRLNEKDCIPSEYYDSGEYRKKLEQSLIGEKAVKDQMDVQKFMLNAIGGLNVLQNQNIADVGCGAGSLLYMTNRVVKSQIAIEPCRPYFEFLKNKGYKVYPDLSSAIKENNQTLDWVLSSQVIEHVESPVEFLKEIYKLLKPGGEAMISTPNRNDILINLLDEFKEFFYRTQHRWYFDKNCIEYCIKKDYNTALIATSSIVHATPASFYANVTSRREYENIALQLRYHDVNYFIGGGQKHFNRRDDKRNLLTEMEDDGYILVNNLSDYVDANNEKLGYFTYSDEPPRINEGRKPQLEELVSATLEKLENTKKPFFVMIEGSQIDWGGHANDVPYIISEFKDFDKAIESSLEFAKDNGNTLVLVTADHETGGFAIEKGNLKRGSVSGDFTTIGHSGSMVPVFSYGKNADLFKGIYENTAIFDKLKTAVGE